MLLAPNNSIEDKDRTEITIINEIVIELHITISFGFFCLKDINYSLIVWSISFSITTRIFLPMSSINTQTRLSGVIFSTFPTKFANGPFVKVTLSPFLKVPDGNNFALVSQRCIRSETKSFGNVAGILPKLTRRVMPWVELIVRHKLFAILKVTKMYPGKSGIIVLTNFPLRFRVSSTRGIKVWKPWRVRLIFAILTQFGFTCARNQSVSWYWNVKKKPH